MLFYDASFVTVVASTLAADAEQEYISNDLARRLFLTS